MDLGAEASRKWSLSAPAWIETMQKGEANRVLLLDAPTKAACGDVAGLDALDVGCGEGRMCRWFSEQGARPVGLDPTPEMIAAARARHPAGTYVEASAESMPFADASFDLVLSYLTLIDIPDFRLAIREMSRLLRPGGKLVIVNLNSFVSTRPRAWHQDAKGVKIHVAVEEYYDERAILLEWAGISIYNWHRPFEAYVQALLGAGLTLVHFEEPRPSLEAVAQHPPMLDEYRVPLFHVMTWRKA